MREPLAQLHRQVDQLRADANRAGKRLAMLFSGKAKRARANAALEQIHAIVADPAVFALHAQLIELFQRPP